MVIGLLKTLVGSRNDRLLKQYRKVVAKVAAFESSLKALDDAALAAKLRNLNLVWLQASHWMILPQRLSL